MFSNSRLVVGQVKGEMEAKDVRMQEYLNQVKRLRPSFDLFSLSHISRSGNTYADSLATLVTSSAGKLPRIILVEHLGRASKITKDTICVHEIRVGPSWMDPTVAFFKNDTLLEGKSEAEKYEETRLDSSCPRIISYTGAPTLGRTYCAFTQMH